jgi:hypothetical protein
MSALDHLRIPPNGSPFPPAAKHNALLDHLCRPDPGRPHHHPRRGAIAVSPVEGHSPSPRSSAQWRPQRLGPRHYMRLDIEPGVINDTLPSILYRRQSDPRGWTKPGTYIEETPLDPNFIERDLLDDINDPPFLVLTDPTIGASKSPDFTLLSDFARPLALRSADYAPFDIWRAHVLVSAAPVSASYFPPSLPPPRLQRYRLVTSPALPVQSFAAQAGGWLELATVYFLRDPSSPEDARLQIVPQEFYAVWSAIAQPGQDISQAINEFDGLTFTVLGGYQIDDLLSESASVEFWDT